MLRQPVILLFLGFLISLSSFGQLFISNPVELTIKSKIKEVKIFLTDISDSLNSNIENLRFIFFYDTTGRRTSLKDFHKESLVRTQHFYYYKDSFDCYKTQSISKTGRIDSNTVKEHEIFDCQSEIYSSSSKSIVIYTSSGLLSVIIGYSKVLINKSGNLNNEDFQTIDTNEPQFILRFEYTFY
ncbi:MAG: hypothetical protein KDD29_08585 [Flavobacteriales bacterium]|nr:hypothetical protein [Flavobacteriales bacterium]MCB9174105.1 hypothetical protein [Flavobacteriales bacterium]